MAFLYYLQSTAVVLYKLCDTGSLIRRFGRDIKSKLKIMSLKVDSCLPQMSEPCWSTDCGSTNRIPGYFEVFEYELEPSRQRQYEYELRFDSRVVRGQSRIIFPDVLCHNV